MNKYCCNCKHEDLDSDEEPCTGCFRDNEFNAENWEAKETKIITE